MFRSRAVSAAYLLLVAFVVAVLAGCTGSSSRHEPAPVAMPDTATADTAAAVEKHFRAHGNEPFWSVEIAGTAVTWRTPEDSLAGTVGPGEAIEGGRRWSGEAGGRTILVTALARVCHDGMSGMPYPETVTVQLGDRRFDGCGGASAALLRGAEWSVVEIAGKPVVADSRVTMTFGEDGRVGGSSSCNSYGADYTVGGEGVTFGQPVSTLKACAEPLMDQEAAFLGTLRAVKRFDVDAQGALVLTADDGRTIRATR
jgi:heat shock protein HslJ